MRLPTYAKPFFYVMGLSFVTSNIYYFYDHQEWYRFFTNIWLFVVVYLLLKPIFEDLRKK
jgi:hypothetical protein